MSEQAVERHICVRRVFRSGGSVRGDVCKLPVIAEVEGEWYCRVHNPDARAKRAKALSDKWATERQQLIERREHATAIHKAERRIIEAAKEWVAALQKSAGLAPSALSHVSDAVRALQEAERA